MKIALFDGIVETHVASSFERALFAAGHNVFNTGKIGHGYAFAKTKTAISILNDVLDNVLEFQPDVIFVFRPASLPRDLLRKAKKSGARLVAWFSDDPVLWDLSYGPIVDSYDLVLHCGTEKVLEFYENQHGRPTGINFPFWTDQQSFPYVFGANPRESDALFLGNVHDEVRRQRYFDLGRLTSDIRIHGNVGKDYFGISGGYLDSDAEVVDAGSRAAVAVNIPQYFRDHEGLDTWFPGLDGLGFFQYPSRVIQYAAMGLPIVSVTPNWRDLESFPEIVCVETMHDLDSAISQLVADEALADLSRRTHDRFLANYSAASRVMALEDLLVNDSWKNLDVRERASWFTQFNGTKTTNDEDTPYSRPIIEIAEVSGESTSSVSLKIAVIGKQPSVVSSPMSVISRAFLNLGHEVSSIDADHSRDVIEQRSGGNYPHALNVDNLMNHVKSDLDIAVVVGFPCEIDMKAHKELMRLGIKMIYLAAYPKSLTKRLSQLIRRVDYMGMLNETFAAELRNAGYGNVHHVPYLVDSEFLEQVAMLGQPVQRVTVASRRRIHYAAQAKAFQDLSRWPTLEIYLEEDPLDVKSLGGLAQSLNSTVVVAPFDASVPGPLSSELYPFVLASRGITVVPRGVGPMNVGIPGDGNLVVRERGELSKKLARLASSPSSVARMRLSADKFVSTVLHAERRMEAILESLNPNSMIQSNGDHERNLGLREMQNAAGVNRAASSTLRSPETFTRANKHGSILNIVFKMEEYTYIRGVHELTLLLDGIPIYSVDVGAITCETSLELHVPGAVQQFNVNFEFRPLGKGNVSVDLTKDLESLVILETSLIKPVADILSVGSRSSTPWGRQR